MKQELECLRHLRELRADGNRIESVEGLHKMDGLVKLSLQRNRIRHIDLTLFRWYAWVCSSHHCYAFKDAAAVWFQIPMHSSSISHIRGPG